MKKLITILMIVAVCGMAQANQTVIDFDAVALRASTVGGIMPAVSENASENGMIATTTLAGQKVYYGTDTFDGWALSRIEEISITYKPTEGSAPYVNLVITNSFGDYGIISAPRIVTAINATENKAVFTVADAASFNFYEPYDSGDDGSLTFAHSSHPQWSDINDWTLLGVGADRPLSPGEVGVARGPVTDGLAILWGDSQANYLGYKEIYDVKVLADGQEYVAGKVVPVPGAFLLGSLGVGCISWMKRRRSL